MGSSWLSGLSNKEEDTEDAKILQNTHVSNTTARVAFNVTMFKALARTRIDSTD
jgi:hypothetical protein